jgi:AraC family transcriptional regulator of adaptative response/methylated-DNA-[protein]-cysteine methyltransferase
MDITLMKTSHTNISRAADTLSDPRWQRVVARDASADGAFYYGVHTTGVYCRPSCASRPAKPENVAFYQNGEDARRAGLRPCKRCKPDNVLTGTARAKHGITEVEHDVRFATGTCSLGPLLVAQSNQGICAILMGDDADQLVLKVQQRFPQARPVTDDALIAQVARFIESPTTVLDAPLDMQGSDFQQRVWRALKDIPVGTTVSYTDIAKRIGAPTAVRAVAHACASNKIAVAVPCHRVVRSDGSLSGYAWGAQRKRALLDREARA